MTHGKSIEDLEQAIERLVQEHIAASRDVARAAVERAFAAAKGASAATTTSAPRRAKAGPNKKREPAEMVEIGERFCRVLAAKPGEAMTVLAADMGLSARDLSRPVDLLRRSGKVRTVGERHLTRYFPMAAGTEPVG